MRCDSLLLLIDKEDASQCCISNSFSKRQASLGFLFVTKVKGHYTEESLNCLVSM